MTYQVAARNVVRAVSLGAVSYLVLSLDFSSGQQAFAQNLPPVTVDAPSQPRARQTNRRPQTSSSRTTRRVAAPALRRVEPVPYVVPSTGALGAPPAPYAGGQVATGSQVGFLGNRGVMNTPFNQVSYTAELMQNQQARTVADVLFNDPSVRSKTPAGNGVDGLYIRGFYYDSGDYAMNGLYGMAPAYSTSANYLDRVEVLKGPGVMLGGMPPAGAIGGSINLVTKRAPDYDITQLTGVYISKSQFGAFIDVARRYGEHKEFGIRFNGGGRGGQTAIDRQTDELGNAVLNMDYRGERARVSVDFGYQAEDLTPPQRFLTFTTSPPFPPPGIPVPPVPRPGTNYMPDWATWKPRDSFAMARAEVDMTDWLTMYAAGGYHRSENNYQYVSPRITNAGGVVGNWSNPALKGFDIFDNYASEIGFRASGHTGPVHHLFTVNYSTFDRDYHTFGRSGGTVNSNLYNPLPIPLPNFTTIVQNLKTQTNMSSVGIADTMSMFGDRLQLVVGARRQTVGADSQNLVNTPPTTSHMDVATWSPGYAIIVKPVENVSLYANYIEGLKLPEIVSGVTTYSNVGEILPPGQTKQMEAGAKVDLGRVTFTGSYFDITAPNATAVFVPGRLPARKLVGEQRNRGIELYTFGELAPWFRVLGGVTFINGEVVSQSYTYPGFGGAIFNYNGKTPVGVSTVNLNIGAEWDTPFVDGLTLTGRVIYTGESYADDANTQVLPAWTRVDLGARYTFLSPWNGKPIVIRAAVENVFNEAYYNSYRTVSSAVSLGAPRTYLVSTTFNF
ncbi:TonB-dependent siderophore receptor [Bradyrhizobium sp. CSA112]|uniref:TonB-dependent receptor n=1 Tax=Bradyrhizobium sp. CSA112 TaxID=2699170 RepID=UPI0023AEFA7B|nr:TonB-dependent siderophore receptor [Bradyrhizobium sp. CSA112]MDE5458738.1 TonB-dependent siderophore receptor [Bradyrhizobium sp. CSA112]